MLRTCLAALCVSLLALPAAPLLAQAPAEAAATATPLEAGARNLVRVLEGTAVAGEVFTAPLLAQVPYPQIAAIAAIYGLELLVAAVQAYVFTILTCVYLRDAVGEAHH